MANSKHPPKDHIWPVKRNILITDMQTIAPEAIVNATNIPRQAYHQQTRKNMREKDQFTILQCFYSPQGLPFLSSPTKFELWIFAVEKKAWLTSCLQSSQVRKLFQEQLMYVSENKAWQAPWQLSISWLGSVEKIECQSTINVFTKGGIIDGGLKVTKLITRETYEVAVKKSK